MSTTCEAVSIRQRFERLRGWWRSPSPLLTGDVRPLSTKQLALIIGGLILLTVIPRALVAMRLVSVCNDGYYYIWAAEMLAGGEYEKPLAYLNVNVYPLILWGLKSAGWDPFEAGQWWGVAVSGLTVIPLFLLLRRLLDTRIAIAGCFLFAIHPELIEISVEPIREATFWFFFVSALALIHRAGQASRSSDCQSERLHSLDDDERIDNPFYGIGWSIAAGLMLALAVHTRTEGWALLAAVFVWMIWPSVRRSDCQSDRTASRDARGSDWQSDLQNTRNADGRINNPSYVRAAIVLAMVPLFLVVVNFTVLHEHDQFEWGRFTAVRNFVEWVAGVESRERVAPPPMTTGSEGEKPRTFAGRCVFFLKEAGGEFEYFNLCLLLFGFLCLRSRLLSRELLPLTIIFGAQMLAVWVRLIQIGNINGRYFLTACVMAIPTAACGALFLLAALRRRCERAEGSPRRYRLIATAAVCCLVAVFWIDVLDSRHASRRREVQLGERLRNEFGPIRLVETDLLCTRAGHAVVGKFPYVEDYHCGDRTGRPIPEVIIIRATSQPRFDDRIAEAGMVPLETLSSTKYRVFVKPEFRVRTAAETTHSRQ